MKEWRNPPLAGVVSTMLIAVGCASGELRDGFAPDGSSEPITALVTNPQTTTIGVDQTVQFVAQGVTSRGENVNVSVRWSASGGTITSSGDFRSSAVGTYQVTARTTSGNLSAGATVHVTDGPITNLPPYAEANGPYSGTVGNPIQFSNLGSYDPETTWFATWDFGDGTPPITQLNPSHTYTAAGTYLARLTVRDPQGLTARDSASVTVTAGGAPPPPPPPPPPPSGPVFMDEDWNVSNLTALQDKCEAQGWCWPRGNWHSTGRMSIDAGQQGGGSAKALRYDYRAGDGPEFTILLPIRPPAVAEAWIEVYAKFSSNFCTFVPGREVGALKFLLFKLGGNGRMDLNAGLFPNAGCTHAQWWSASLDGRLGENTNQRIGDDNPRWDGQWHQYRVHVKLGNPGRQRVWVDGALWQDRTYNTVDWDNNPVNSWQNGEWDLGANLNDGSPRDMSIWWGRVRIYTQNPGW